MGTYELGSDRFLIARPEDLLHLEVFLVPGEQSVLLLFPSQHVMEFPRGDLVADRNVVPALGADPGFPDIRYQLPAAEAMASGEQLLTSLDRKPGRGLLELPTMVQLRTRGNGIWDLSPRPRTGAGGWAAIWYAELLETLGQLPGVPGPLLEVFSTQDPGFEPPGFGIEPITLFPDLRQTVFRGRLTMSMLGATGRIQGPHTPPGVEPPVTLTSYDHSVQFGRDQRTTAVLQGTLSSGHRAELEIVTRRVFAQMRSTGQPVFEPDETTFMPGQTYVQARLVQTATLSVVDPVVTFTTRDTPFRTVRITPDVVGQVDLQVGAPNPFFWVRRSNEDVRFNLVATDWAGNEVAFSLPLMFIRRGAQVSAEALQAHLMSAPEDHRRFDLGGAPITLADPGSRDGISVDQLTMPVHGVALEIKKDVLGTASALVPKSVDVALEAAGRLTAKAEQATCELLHAVDEAGNFLTIPGGLPVAFPASAVGGLANPDVLLGAVNAATGAIPTGAVDQMFAQAKVLGVQLLDLLPDLPGPLPELTSVQLPDRITTTYDWTPALETGRTAGFLSLEDESVLHLHATAVLAIDLTTGQPRPPTSRVEGKLTKATVSLLDVITVRFEELHFLDEPDKSPAVTATGVEVHFLEQLEFVEKLAAEIADFGSGCPIHVDPSGITAGYDLVIPNVGIGVFSLSNITLGAEVTIPFTAKPASVRFHFGERHRPFNLSVHGIGGGGFFALRASTSELELVEAALEFGGTVDISVFVATGEVHAMGGISLKRTPKKVEVVGYLRCGGHVSVLDIVVVSVEFEMGLGYSSGEEAVRNGNVRDIGPAIVGRASVTVSISVLVLTESVSFEVEKRFHTEEIPGSPLEALEIDAAAWDLVCAAFA